MATKELTEILQTAGAAGDASIGLSASGGLVRRDSVPFDADGSSANSSGTDLFIGVSVSGDARLFNAIPYIKDDTPATPTVNDLVIGQGSDGSAKQFTVASLATTLEGESFGTAAFVNTGTGPAEVPTNADLTSYFNRADYTDFRKIREFDMQSSDSDDIVICDSGNIALILDRAANEIRQYDFSTPYDVSTLASTSTFLDLSDAITGSCTGFDISADGTVLVICDATTGVFEYELSTPFNVSTATYTAVTLSESLVLAVTFADGGDLLYISVNGDIKHYTLSTAYDISTGTVSASVYTAAATGVRISSDGKRAYVMTSVGGFDHISLSTDYILSDGTASVEDSVSVDSALGFYVHPRETSIYIANSFVTSQFNTTTFLDLAG